jgi:hypothetical protein
MRYLLFLKHIGLKLLGVLQTLQGWVVAGVLFLLDFIAGHEMAVGLVVFVTLMDAVWGIAVSIKRKKFAISELARMTVGKLAVYGCAMLAFIGLDRLIGMTLTASVIGAVITLVELWSASASMLILFPNFLFLKLLKKALTGEIADKLGIDPSQVEEVLADSRKASDATMCDRGEREEDKVRITKEQTDEARRRAGYDEE